VPGLSHCQSPCPFSSHFFPRSAFQIPAFQWSVALPIVVSSKTKTWLQSHARQRHYAPGGSQHFSTHPAIIVCEPRHSMTRAGEAACGQSFTEQHSCQRPPEMGLSYWLKEPRTDACPWADTPANASDAAAKTAASALNALVCRVVPDRFSHFIGCRLWFEFGGA
jgi:hypothetical protein